MLRAQFCYVILPCLQNINLFTGRYFIDIIYAVDFFFYCFADGLILGKLSSWFVNLLKWFGDLFMDYVYFTVTEPYFIWLEPGVAYAIDSFYHVPDYYNPPVVYLGGECGAYEVNALLPLIQPSTPSIEIILG